MLRIEIKSANTGEQIIPAGTNSKGKPYDSFVKVSQTGYVHGMVDRNGSPEPYAVKINIDLGTTKERRPAYPVGMYDVNAASFYVNRFDSLELGTLSLSPVVQPVKAAA